MGYLRLLVDLYKMQRNTTKTRKKIEKIQMQRLQRILIYAYKHSAYYQQTFTRAGIKEDDIKKLPLSAFPSINKEILMEHFDEIVTTGDLKQDNIRKFDATHSLDEKTYLNKYHIVHSSGSTGIPRFFVYDNYAWSQMLLGIIRGALWDMSFIEMLKLLFHEPRILYIATTDGRYGGAMAVSDGITGVRAKQMLLDIKTPLVEWAKKVTDFKPNIIIGYPSAIKILGELMEQSPALENVIRVVSCGEPLNSSMRHYLEKTYKSTVVNFYGASESLALGVETDAQKGMYLFDDMNYIEIIKGQMYLTCFYNFTQPLIRYRLSDQLVLKNKVDTKCKFTVTEVVSGREEDIMWFTDSKGNKEFLHPLDIEGICVEGLLDYQFQQIGTDSFEILAEINNITEKKRIKLQISQIMKRILREKHLEYVHFTIKCIREILPDSRTGKKRLVI